MDTGVEQPRELPLKQIVRGSGTRDVLAHAARQAKDRNLDDYLIIDVDAHHYENQSWSEVIDFIPDPVIKDIAENFNKRGQGLGIIQSTSWPYHQDVGGRIPHECGMREGDGAPDVHPDVERVRRALECLSINRQVTFPTPMLSLGLHPPRGRHRGGDCQGLQPLAHRQGVAR